MPRPSQVGLQTLQLVKDSPLEVVKRLRPPAELTPEQKEEFIRVVDSMPADWFAPGHTAALVQYCRHVIMARKVAQVIDAMMLSEDIDPIKISELVKRQEAESRIIGKLMTMLRLTPQSIEPPKVSAKRLRQKAEDSPWSELGS